MENTSTFLGAWNQYMYLAAVASVAAGILIFLYHEFKILKIKDYKDKYDYVNLHEIRYFWYSVIALIIAAAFFANTVAQKMILEDGMRWFYVRMFITASFVVIAYFIFFSLVRIYYPRQLEKRLTRLRTTPRISPHGNPMRRLTEDEEDVHLETSQIEEENIHAVDYDVWLDDKTGYKAIEKYPPYQHAVECSECGYFTLKISHEEIEQAPTDRDRGLMLQHYKCSYCGHREQREVSVAKLSTNVK